MGILDKIKQISFRMHSWDKIIKSGKGRRNKVKAKTKVVSSHWWRIYCSQQIRSMAGIRDKELYRWKDGPSFYPPTKGYSEDTCQSKADNCQHSQVGRISRGTEIKCLQCGFPGHVVHLRYTNCVWITESSPHFGEASLRAVVQSVPFVHTTSWMIFVPSMERVGL